MSTAPLPDAARQNWVDRYAPEGLKPWLKLGRFDRPIGTWLLLLPGWQGIMLALNQYDRPFGGYELWLILGFAVGACLMRGAGCAVNDIVDRDFDAQVARTALRPIPAGQISVKQAWAFVAGLSLVSLCILLTMNLMSVLLGALSLGLVAAYPFMKRITWWPQAWLGLTFNWGALLGFAAATGGLFSLGWLYVLEVRASGDAYWMAEGLNRMGHVALSALLLYAGGLTLGMAGEASAWSLHSGHLALSALLLYAGGLFWTLGYDTIYALHLAWQVKTLKPEDGALALRLFKSNREAGLILLAAIALNGLAY